jgi:hypothetical protein
MTVPKMPKRYWDDLNWARTHHTELLRDYRDQWVAVVDHEIVSNGRDLGQVEQEAEKKTNKKYIATMFIDGGEHIYGL